MQIAIIICLCVIVGLGIYCYKLRATKIQIISLNTETQQANDLLQREYQLSERECERSKARLAAVQDKILDKQHVLDTIDSTIDTAKKQVSNVYKLEFERLDDKYKADKKHFTEQKNSLIKQLESEYADRFSAISKEFEEQQAVLDDLRAKQTAYLEAERRKQEIEEKKDYYRLVLSDDDLADVTLLRHIQGQLRHKESVDKVIYETYFRPAYDLLMARLFGAKSSTKVCGIYKITNLDTGIAYIGQSVDIKERFRTHIKTALSCAPSTNKLYQEMKRAGLDHFSFEVLEEVPRLQLNEREVYWIDFYQTKEFGLNGTKGGA